jgi:2-isopropylmalate synthase
MNPLCYVCYCCATPGRRFKNLADKKKGITDDDIMALMSDELHQPTTVWELQDLQIVCGTMGMPTATVQMKGPDGISRIGVGVGTGRWICVLVSSMYKCL